MRDPASLEQRIDALEMRLTYQDETIDALNMTVTAQWAQIDALTRQLAKLKERLEQTDASRPHDAMTERPPHY